MPGASWNETQSPEVLIISPTRELTLQIYNEARKFVHGSVYRPVVVYGGTSVGHQLAQVEKGSNIVVGTPGRLMDFLRRGKVRVRGERGGLGESTVVLKRLLSVIVNVAVTVCVYSSK